MHPKQALSEPIQKGEIAMWMRTKVRKCTTFFDKSLQAQVVAQYAPGLRDFGGVKSAFEFAQAITWMCFSGTSLGYGEVDIPRLPPVLRINPRFFLGGWSDCAELLKLIAKSTRVEIKIGFCNVALVQAQATFFLSGKVQLGHLLLAYHIETGQYAGFTFQPGGR